MNKIHIRVVKSKGKKTYTYQGFHECECCGQYVVVINPDSLYQTYGEAEAAGAEALVEYMAHERADQEERAALQEKTPNPKK